MSQALQLNQAFDIQAAPAIEGASSVARKQRYQHSMAIVREQLQETNLYTKPQARHTSGVRTQKASPTLGWNPPSA